MGAAWQEVTERLDTVFLPEDANKPLILRYDPSLDPVLRLALASTRDDDQGPAGLKRLRTYAEQDLRRRLEQIEGVAAVRVLGGLEEQISVELQEEALRRTGLSIQEVGRRLQVENVNLAGRRHQGGRHPVPGPDGERVPEPAKRSPSWSWRSDRRPRASSSGDVGVVRSGWADREVITRFEGAEAIEVEIQKEADANMVAMAATFARRPSRAFPADGTTAAQEGSGQIPFRRVGPCRSSPIAAPSSGPPSGGQERRDRGRSSRGLRALPLPARLPRDRGDLGGDPGLGGGDLRADEPQRPVTLNLMSLGGLALGIGMLVDSAIVVVESIARCREEGDSTTSGAVVSGHRRGRRRRRGLGTLTTVAVFAPMVVRHRRRRSRSSPTWR